MSSDDGAELMDLFEYDEFDSYDEYAYQTANQQDDSVECGVPLSVELSESLSKNDNAESEQDASCFVRSAEIFLRIDGEGTSANNRAIQDQSSNNAQPNSLESNGSDDVILVGNDCVELQYENEFIESNDEAEFLPTNRCRSNSLSNDYEELLFEGKQLEKPPKSPFLEQRPNVEWSKLDIVCCEYV